MILLHTPVDGCIGKTGNFGAIVGDFKGNRRQTGIVSWPIELLRLDNLRRFLIHFRLQRKFTI